MKLIWLNLPNLTFKYDIINLLSFVYVQFVFLYFYFFRTMSSTLQDKHSDVKLHLMYRISSTIQQLQSEMCDVNGFIEDNFRKISKSVLENIAGEVDLI